jgi:hypothetical protein
MWLWTSNVTDLKFLHQNGPNLLFSPLRDILQGYMLYRPDIGYMSGMSHLLATLLLYTDVCHYHTDIIYDGEVMS